MELGLIYFLIGYMINSSSTPTDPEVAARNAETMRRWGESAHNFLQAHGSDVIFAVAVVAAVCMAIWAGCKMFRYR